MFEYTKLFCWASERKISYPGLSVEGVSLSNSVETAGAVKIVFIKLSRAIPIEK